MLRPGELLIHDGLTAGELRANLYAYDPGDGRRRGRGHDPSQVVRAMFDPPSGMPLNPRSEWSQRLKDKIAEKSLNSDVHRAAGIEVLDQGQVGYCATADTEVLTERGFVPWPEYGWQDRLATVNLSTGMLEYQGPTRRHVYEYDGPMVYSTNRRIDFGMTPDHRMLVRTWDQGRRTLAAGYTFQRAGELGWYSGLMAAPRGYRGTELARVAVEGDREYAGDDFVSLLGILCSCGYAGGTGGTKNLVSFCCFGERAGEVAALAARTGFHEKPSERGVWVRYGAGALAEWLRKNAYAGAGHRAPQKRVPDLVKVASGRQIGLFVDWFYDRDRGGGRGHYYSSSRRMIDDLQELFLKLGRRGTVTGRGPREATRADGRAIHSAESYELHVSETDRLCLERKKHLETDRYRGLVYCATVPNGTLVTRRGGTVLISGNCWAHSTTQSVMLSRALSNQPYVPLSAYAVAATIKKGRDEGGWCGLSAQFARDKGIPAQSVWPQGDRNYRSYDKPEVWASAALHKITEEWSDLASQVYDQNLTFDQLISGLLGNLVGPVDFNWWSHSVTGADPVEGASQRDSYRLASGKLPQLREFELHWGMNHPVTGGFGLRILNSWSKTWSDGGFGVLTGNKAVPDGALLIRSTTASAA